MKVYLETYGCTLNQADSDFLAGLLESRGYTLAKNESDARIIILNTCTVKGATENKILERLKRIKKKVIVAGCLAVNEGKIRKIKPGCVIVYPSAIGNMADAIKDCIKGNQKTYKTGNNKEYISKRITYPILRISIQEGCVGNCHFCQTKFARPKLVSYNELRIIEWIESGIARGAKEIQLTGMDLGAYGLDRQADLIGLLEKIEKINGNFKVRLGMINPMHARRMLDGLVVKLNGEKFYKFMHIPVQTGSEKVCREMNRGHKVSDFVYCTKKLREKIPDITIATDIIVGYPTESEADFLDTIKLIGKIKPDIVNVSKFTPRDRTVAKKMKQLDSKIIKKRTGEIAGLCKKVALEKNEKLVGKKYEILVTEKQKDYTGRNGNYKQVIVKDFRGKLGKSVKVKIIGANHGCLISQEI